jgi:hypothetical protein
LLAQRKVTKRKGIPGARASHALSHLHCQRVVLTRIHARQDSIDHPWSIDPTSEAVAFDLLRTGFGELNGKNILPVKFAEAFDFGRENPTWTSDLALSSPDGESRRPVGKVECLGDPKGKLFGRRSFGYFSYAVVRKVTRQQGETKCV